MMQTEGVEDACTVEFELVYWQRIVSSHQVELVATLAAIPSVKITYVAERNLSDSRKALGWKPRDLDAAKLVIADSKNSVERLIESCPSNVIHICQGIRGNGLVGYAEKLLQKRKARVVILTETVNDTGPIGLIKRLVYRYHLKRMISWVDIILAIGKNTGGWIAQRGFPKSRVVPFTYFLGLPSIDQIRNSRMLGNSVYRFAFVGRFVSLKRLNLLVDALALLQNEYEFKLLVVGGGPLENSWKRLSKEKLGERVDWKGLMQEEEVLTFLSTVDCLVLPSRVDGWGAVVSEALMVGTQAVCSDRCGASEAVHYSGVGGVFPVDNLEALTSCLRDLLARGALGSKEREKLAEWASNLGCEAGANYLIEILRYRFSGGTLPRPPWERNM
ncbi:MAG: glycosyltransferase family 4 protein [Gammaproteobacteria bacterium]|nr:glycosyltransferase family 4 protein [Gammaproteobacteria bacterium]